MEQLNEAVEKRAGGTRLKKGGGMGGPLLLALGLTAAIAGGAYLSLCAYAQNSAAIWKNTYVLEQNIGGLTQEELFPHCRMALSLQHGKYLLRRHKPHPAGQCQDGRGGGTRGRRTVLARAGHRI